MVSNWKVRSHLIKCSNLTSEFRNQKESHLRYWKLPFWSESVTRYLPGWQEEMRSRSRHKWVRNFQFCITVLPGLTLAQTVVISKNWHSWYVLTACESGRWETVNGWVKHPSVMCLLCLFLFLSWWHKWIFPWTPCFHLTWLLLRDLS